jgi:hypothetical protein
MYQTGEQRRDSAEWTRAKQRGDVGEKLTKKFLGMLGMTVKQAEGRQSGFDFLTLDKIEAKTDYIAQRTGRVAIECEYAGKPSGISVTTSFAWWIFVAGDDGFELLIIPVETLRALVKNRVAIPAGDGKRARVCLIKLEILREHSTGVFRFVGGRIQTI